MRTETRVVMFTDIKGFTAATSRQTRDENARMLALHDALVHPVIRAFGGRRVKTIGDAYLVVFGAPTQALLCAMAVQDRLWEYDRRAPEAERIEIRIAVSLGEVRIARGDVFGDAVNLASRVQGEARGGEIWFTEGVYWTLDRDHVSFEEVGYRALKGIADKVRLFRVTPGGTTGAPPYANAALSLVEGLPPPDPATLEKAIDLAPMSTGSRLGPRLRIAALGLVAAAGGVTAWWFHLPLAERELRRGHHEAARAAIDELERSTGENDPQVLFLRGRYEEVLAESGRGGSMRRAVRSWSRALAGGSADALAALRREARSEDCARRSQAARALVDSRSRDALEALVELSERDPPPPPPAGALEALRSAFAGSKRCDAGDAAREGIAALERPRE